jgi:polyferredoxin
MTANASQSPLEMLKTPFVFKTFAFVVFLGLVGVAAWQLMDPEEPFVGLIIGMSWSLAALIVAVGLFFILGDVVREQLGRER